MHFACRGKEGQVFPGSILHSVVAAIRLTVVAGLVTMMAAPPGTAAPIAPPEGPGSGSGVAAVLCERGFVYSQTRHGCVGTDSVSDEELYAQGRALALAGHYNHALDALEAVTTRSDARVLTMIGYAKRKLGRYDESIAAYKDALAIDPDSVDAREYLGEAYAEIGRLDLARAELDRIEAICGNRCEQYFDLAEAIADALP